MARRKQALKDLTGIRQRGGTYTVPSPPTGLVLRDRAPGGALIPVEPHCDQPLVHHIRTDTPPGAVHPLLTLSSLLPGPSTNLGSNDNPEYTAGGGGAGGGCSVGQGG
jgi:hypothetical protein